MILSVLTLQALRAMAPDEAASTLLLRRMEGAGDIDASVLEAWLDEDLSHRRAWENVQRAWDAWESPLDETLLRELGDIAPPKSEAWRWRLAAAVVVLALGGSGALLATHWRSPGPSAAAPMERVAYAVPPGAPSNFVLPDGSRMTLEGGSRLERSYSSGQRDLKLLNGRGYFEVAKNPARPFVVEAGGQRVTATGTRFDVVLDPGRVSVVLAEGHVRVESLNGATRVQLAPGELFEQAAQEAPKVSKVAAEPLVAWKDGYVEFNDTPVAQALEEINRGSPDQVVVHDPRVAALRINGSFRTGDALRFARSIAGVHPLRVIQTGPHAFELALKSKR